MIGKNLGQYKIVELLGRGGMGEVYRARDTRLGREVAVKLLPTALKDDAERRSRFEREARTVAALNHPNVVTLHAVEEAEDLPFLVMELVEGRTLDTAIPADGLALDRFFDLALPLTEAVAAAHAKGITHRDLKPQNVMITTEGRLKVLDFGLAKALEPVSASQDMTVAVDTDVTREGVIVGTAAYMSPEQAEGKPVDARSDVFSLGILLYQMITGQQPFRGDTHMSTLTAVLRDEPHPVLDIRPALPRHFARILRRCLEKDPDRRYETARGINYDLETLRDEVVSGEHEKPDLTADPVADDQPARNGAPARTEAPARNGALARETPGHRTGRRHSWPAWLLGAAAVVAVVAGIAWLRPGASGDGSSGVAVTGSSAPPSPSAPTIVVFPFENLGPSADAYFAAGITDEIVTSLTGIEGLRVVSRTSALQYDRTGKSMAQIASELGVDYVLEGSVRWQRGSDETSRVRVTPQLMNAATDEQVWAEAYDGAMAEIFKVQSDIAGEVVRNLGVTLAMVPAETAADVPTEDMPAYHAYLQAKDIMDTSRFEADSWFLAVDLLEKAVERDPSFFEAWAELNRANSGLCHFDWDRTDERLARARTAADRAMSLRPEAARSFAARGLYYYWGLKDYERALVAFREASRIRPDAPRILESMAYVLRRQEAYAEAADMLLRVAELSPGDPALCIHVSETLAILGRYEEADRWANRAIELGPGQAMAYTLAAWAAIQAGRPDRARGYLADIPPSTDPEIRHNSFKIRYELRDYAAALREADALPELHESQYVVVSRDLARAMAHVAMERQDAARQDFARAEAVFRAKLMDKPGAGNLVAAHAVALAGMGRGEEALTEIRRCFDLYPISKDPWIRTWRLYDLAYIQMLSGRPRGAVQTLAELMSKQTDIISPWILENTPHFDGLRDREDFQGLLAGQS